MLDESEEAACEEGVGELPPSANRAAVNQVSQSEPEGLRAISEGVSKVAGARRSRKSAKRAAAPEKTAEEEPIRERVLRVTAHAIPDLGTTLTCLHMLAGRTCLNRS